MLYKNKKPKAIEFVEAHAAKYTKKAAEHIAHICKMCNIPNASFEKMERLIQTKASVALHFHPDRLDINKQTVAASLLASGNYKNQFETHLSNGKLAPTLGGDRDRWEQNLFGDSLSDLALSQRPKYGALNLLNAPNGPAPRFGSCYFILHPACTKLTTFTYLDSFWMPEERGTLLAMKSIFASLLIECFERDYALGETNINPAKLVDKIIASVENPFPDLVDKKIIPNLNHYIEAQVHCPIDLENDVETLVVDPSFKNTEIGNTLIQLAEKYALKLNWHKGYQLAVEKVPDNFRGNTMPSLAKQVAPDGILNAYKIGLAAKQVNENPKAWKDRGLPDFCLQELKLLWHVLVKFNSN